jgi:hypothetical protein
MFRNVYAVLASEDGRPDSILYLRCNALYTLFIRFGWYLVHDICTWSYKTFASLVKIGVKKPALSLRLYKNALCLYRKTMWYLEGKERLDKVCATSRNGSFAVSFIYQYNVSQEFHQVPPTVSGFIMRCEHIQVYSDSTRVPRLTTCLLITR